MPKPIKTNAMRQLDAAHIAYEPKTYEVDENDLSGVHIAEQIGLPFVQTFKTLVATGDKTGPMVFCLPVHREIDMTGEISLLVNVLAIGGLKEKTMAAYNAGVQTVLIPQENLRDIEELDPLARENLNLIPCRKMADVLKQALIPTKNEIKAEEAAESVAASKYIPVSVPTPTVGQVRFTD